VKRLRKPAVVSNDRRPTAETNEQTGQSAWGKIDVTGLACANRVAGLGLHRGGNRPMSTKGQRSRRCIWTDDRQIIEASQVRRSDGQSDQIRNSVMRAVAIRWLFIQTGRPACCGPETPVWLGPHDLGGGIGACR